MKARRVDFSPDEWLGGTVPLTLAERGLYITACALIYSAGEPIPIDHLKAACRDHGHTFNAALRRLFALGKLTLEGLLITNERCTRELQNAVKRASNGRQNVVKRWAKDRQKEPEPVVNNGLEGNSVILARAFHQPSTINMSPNGDKRARELRTSLAQDFANFWLTYPHKVGKGAAEAKYRTARKSATQAELLDGVARYKRTKPDDRPWCNPATWLNQQRWLDQPDLPLSNGHDDRPPPAPLDPRSLGHSLPCACSNCTRWVALHQEVRHA